MNYKTHITGGLVAGALYVSLCSPEIASIPIILSGAALGSLVPDIDHRNSYLGRRFRITSYITNKAFGHRGVVHAPIIMASLCTGLTLLANIFSPATYIFNMFFIYIYLGIFSHIFLDMFNVTGVPFLYPFDGRYISFGKIKGGSISETLVRLVLYVLLIWIIVRIVS